MLLLVKNQKEIAVVNINAKKLLVGAFVLVASLAFIGYSTLENSSRVDNNAKAQNNSRFDEPSITFTLSDRGKTLKLESFDIFKGYNVVYSLDLDRSCIETLVMVSMSNDVTMSKQIGGNVDSWISLSQDITYTSSNPEDIPLLMEYNSSFDQIKELLDAEASIKDYLATSNLSSWPDDPYENCISEPQTIPEPITELPQS